MFKEEREQCEAIGVTVAEMDAMRSKAADVLAQVDNYIAKLEPACKQYPFLGALIDVHLASMANALSVGYRLMENRKFDEDDPEQFDVDRGILLNLIKETYQPQKGMNA